MPIVESHEIAFEEIAEMLVCQWEDDSDTLEIPVVWGNVAHEKQGSQDLFGNINPYLMVDLVHQTSRIASLKGRNGSRREYTGMVVARLHTQADKGTVHGLPLISVAEAAFSGKSSPSGVWFRNPQITSLGRQGTWYVHSMTVTFIYDLIR